MELRICSWQEPTITIIMMIPNSLTNFSKVLARHPLARRATLEGLASTSAIWSLAARLTVPSDHTHQWFTVCNRSPVDREWPTSQQIIPGRRARGGVRHSARTGGKLQRRWLANRPTCIGPYRYVYLRMTMTCDI